MGPRTLSDRHDQTETDRALWFFSTGPKQTNLNLQTGLSSNGGSKTNTNFPYSSWSLKTPHFPQTTFDTLSKRKRNLNLPNVRKLASLNKKFANPHNSPRPNEHL